MKSNPALIELLGSFEKHGQSFFLDQASHVSNLKAAIGVRQSIGRSRTLVMDSVIYRTRAWKLNSHRHVIRDRDIAGDALTQPSPHESEQKTASAS
jgi:hypothetical protein